MVVHDRVHKRPACKGGDRKAGAPSSYNVVKVQLNMVMEDKEKVEKKLEKELEEKKKLENELEEKKAELEKEQGEKKWMEKMLEVKEAELEAERVKRGALVAEAVQKRVGLLCNRPF